MYLQVFLQPLMRGCRTVFFDRIAVGVQLHAMAGDAAAGRLGEHSVMARDIIDSIPELLK